MSESMLPIISIVVPTKNRYKYLKHLIALIEGFNDNRIELLVHDNSDDNSEILEFLSSKRIVSTVYYHDTDCLSMGENAERGINKAKGEYICFIGDDDAVCRNIADCAEWMKSNQIDAVRSLYLNYCWNEDKGENGGTAYFDDISFLCRVGDPIAEMKKVLNDGVPDFKYMAKIYHGIVKKSVLEDVQRHGECLFPGPTPDMSGAVSIAFFIKKYVMIKIPVVIPGMSRMVGGGVMGKVLSLGEVKFITNSDIEKWPVDYPPLWATELIWPVCVINALKSVNHAEYISELDKNKLLSRLVIIHRTYFKEALHYADNVLLFLFDFMCYFLKEGVIHLYETKIKSKLNGKLLGKYTVANGFDSIADAENFLMTQIKNFNFERIKIKQSE